MTMNGLLRVTGKVDLSQFWPKGGSDADTVSVLVTGTSFEFSADGSVKGLRRTRVFEGAEIGGKKVLKAKGTVTIRVQGIDAPELHFAALIKRKGLKDNGTKFRQLQGETSTFRLREVLTTGKPAVVPCQVLTRINLPNDAFDMYGRLVGDVIVGTGAKQVSIAHWLASNGWALPTYYNSMLTSEIRLLQKRCNEAKKKKVGIWPHLIDVIGPPQVLTFRKGGPFSKSDEIADRGPFVMPKMFRRRTRYEVLVTNQIAPASFRDYLDGAPIKGDKKGSKDSWVTVDAFLKNPNIKDPKNSLAALLNKQNVFSKGPGDLVFFEALSQRLKKNGKNVTSWTFV